MQTIWKYPLAGKAKQVVELPMGYEILSCQKRAGKITLWVRHETDNEKMAVNIVMLATGAPEPPEYLEFLATIQYTDETMIHVFREVSGA